MRRTQPESTVSVWCGWSFGCALTSTAKVRGDASGFLTLKFRVFCAEVEILAGRVISLQRMMLVRALPKLVRVRTAIARDRLNSIDASTRQAALAAKKASKRWLLSRVGYPSLPFGFSFGNPSAV